MILKTVLLRVQMLLAAGGLLCILFMSVTDQDKIHDHVWTFSFTKCNNLTAEGADWHQFCVVPGITSKKEKSAKQVKLTICVKNNVQMSHAIRNQLKSTCKYGFNKINTFVLIIYLTTWFGALGITFPAISNSDKSPCFPYLFTLLSFGMKLDILKRYLMYLVFFSIFTLAGVCIYLQIVIADLYGDFPKTMVFYLNNTLSILCCITFMASAAAIWIEKSLPPSDSKEEVALIKPEVSADVLACPDTEDDSSDGSRFTTMDLEENAMDDEEEKNEQGQRKDIDNNSIFTDSNNKLRVAL